MSYFSLIYLFVFLPIVVILYSIVPQKKRYILLLIASYSFFFLLSGKLVLCLVVTSLLIYFVSLWLDKIEEKREYLLSDASKEEKKMIKTKYDHLKKLILIISIIILFVSLVFYKYLPFFTHNLNDLLALFGINHQFKIIKFIAPIGISYYTLGGISYLIDIYRGKIKPTKNILKLALFMAFFPKIMEGPIARYDEEDNLYAGKKITYKNLCFGTQRILWGMLKKFIVADRLNPLVKIVFANYQNYDGGIIFLAVMAYTLMLYTEFSGTMDIVIGSAEIFDINLPENFRQPFFAKNISDFWSRWHITLGTWFKDYIFYPLSLSKPIRKLSVACRKNLGKHLGMLIPSSIALLVVWLFNGLWHGAGWSFIFYGIYQFTLIVMGNAFLPLVKILTDKLHINRSNLIYRIMQSVKLTFFVFIGELFFRAPTVKIGFAMLRKIFTNFTLKGFFDKTIFNLGLDAPGFIIIIAFVILLFIVSLLKELGYNVRELISKQKGYVRVIIYYALILMLIIFGAYGTGYVPVDPIYADF